MRTPNVVADRLKIRPINHRVFSTTIDVVGVSICSDAEGFEDVGRRRGYAWTLNAVRMPEKMLDYTITIRHRPNEAHDGTHIDQEIVKLFVAS